MHQWAQKVPTQQHSPVLLTTPTLHHFPVFVHSGVLNNAQDVQPQAIELEAWAVRIEVDLGKSYSYHTPNALIISEITAP